MPRVYQWMQRNGNIDEVIEVYLAAVSASLCPLGSLHKVKPHN